MASKSPGHANSLFRVTRMSPDSIILEEPSKSFSSRLQGFGKVTLVSRDASLGSFWLDMMTVRLGVQKDALMVVPLTTRRTSAKPRVENS